MNQVENALSDSDKRLELAAFMGLQASEKTTFFWEQYEKEGFNPVDRSKVLAVRRRVKVDLELPMKDDYARFLRRLMKIRKSRQT